MTKNCTSLQTQHEENCGLDGVSLLKKRYKNRLATACDIKRNVFAPTLTFNQVVAGSIPARITTHSQLEALQEMRFVPQLDGCTSFSGCAHE